MIEAPSRTSDYDRTTAVRRTNDRLAAVAPHLTLLRDFLACDTYRDQHGHQDGRSRRGHVPPRRRKPAPSAGRLTLAQWVSKTKNIGTPVLTADEGHGARRQSSPVRAEAGTAVRSVPPDAPPRPSRCRAA